LIGDVEICCENIEETNFPKNHSMFIFDGIFWNFFLKMMIKIGI